MVAVRYCCPRNAEWAGLLQVYIIVFSSRLQLSIPLVVLSACGWLLFVVGFGAFNLRDN